VRWTESPKVTNLTPALEDRDFAWIDRADFPPARRRVGSLRADRPPLPAGAPRRACSWRCRTCRGASGWPTSAGRCWRWSSSTSLDLLFWVKFVYATQLGAWSFELRSLRRNFWGLGKHLLDLPVKLALPLALWAGFYLRRLLLRGPPERVGPAPCRTCLPRAPPHVVAAPRPLLSCGAVDPPRRAEAETVSRSRLQVVRRPGRAATSPPVSPPSSGPTAAARATSRTPSPGCSASRAPRALRSATRMEDVIFNGSERRKPLGMAEVTLTSTPTPPSRAPRRAGCRSAAGCSAAAKASTASTASGCASRRSATC
jgi:hypothetical protein